MKRLKLLIYLFIFFSFLKDYKDWLDIVVGLWVPTNITAPNNQYVLRFNNSLQEKKISI